MLVGLFSPAETSVVVPAATYPAPACVTVSVWPAIVIVPVRVAPTLAVKLKLTTPLPVPFVVFTVIHGVVVDTAHAPVT